MKNQRSRLIIVISLLFLSVITFFRADLAVAGGLTSQDLARMRWVEDVKISPGGDYIAYTKAVQRDPFEDNGPFYLELHVCDLEGNSRSFITGEVTVKKIDWTPDGKYISYIAMRNEDETKSLYRIPIDGGESEKVIEHATDIIEYSWAPDNKRVAFLAKDSLTEIADSLKELGFNQEIYEEDWQSVRVWIYNIDDKQTETHSLDLPGSASSLFWSPEGNLLGLALAPTSLIDDKYMYRRVSLVNPDSGQLIHTFNNPGKLGAFAWSPDEKYLAYITGSDEHDPMESELAMVDIDEKKIIPVITNYDGHIVDVDWLDPKTMIYRADQGVMTLVGKINIDGTGNEILIPPVDPPLTDMTVSWTGKTAAFIGSGFDHPWELYYCRIGDKEAKRLTFSNSGMEGIDFGRQEVITYTARDGLKLQGILIYPVTETDKQKYPLILSVHGGPESNRKNGWLTWYSAPGQVAAGRGFAVFYPNYRGSTGRGVEFSKMGQGDYAGGEFNDLVDAVEYLADAGIIDKKKVGITGRSYGGYATAWAATALSEHFAAGVMAVGVSDLISKFGTTDIPMEMYLVHARSWPWERWQWYLEQSPIYHAHKSRTPLLILHGKEDPRVHPSQSMELYRYLKTLNNAPVRMIFYPGEEHGTKNAAARYDTNLRIMRWFEHYLIGSGGDPPAYEMEYRSVYPELN